MLQTIFALQALAGRLTDRVRDEDQGATAVEYGLMVALIAIVIIVAVTAVGDQLAIVFDDIATSLGGL
jgi:pilus assembly protein Flp/PilA